MTLNKWSTKPLVNIQPAQGRGCTMRAIALSLDHSASSISRELARNVSLEFDIFIFKLA